jgi:hypothetical protein
MVGFMFMYIIYLGKSAVGGIKSIWKVGRWPKIFGLKLEKSLENLPFEIRIILDIGWGFLGI